MSRIMSGLHIDISNIYSFIPELDVNNLKLKAEAANESLHNKTGKGNEFLGWVNLPSSIKENDLARIEATAMKLQKEIDLVVVIGIGGSYLGTKAVADALSDSFQHLKNNSDVPLIIFAGQNIGEDYLSELLELLDQKRYAIVVISKSGTTTEPAIAFRLLKSHLEKKVGEVKAKELIIAVTDTSAGSLHKLSKNKGYETFIIPDDVGGRYSVLTPVGLVPLAIVGIDIRALIKGAAEMEERCSNQSLFEKNPAARYAAARNLLYRKGKKIEILANFDNKLHYFSEWWKQLYGESEGKEGKGIFPDPRP